MNALQRERPSATVVDRTGNDILVWLGEYDLTAYSDQWNQDTAEVYILVDEEFANSDPHWVVTTPALSVGERDAGNIPSRSAFTRDHNSHGDKVEMVLDISDADSGVAFSWRWSNMNREPENATDLQQAHQLVEFLLRLSKNQRRA